MRLDELLAGVDVLEHEGDVSATAVTAVVHDAGAVVPGALFCCIRGARADGHDFAATAVAAGASSVLCERFVDVSVPQVRVADVRAALGPVAAAFFGHPSRDLAVVGVTGTNGKTTTTHMLASVLEVAGMSVGVIGTLSGHAGPPTTPDAPALQHRLASFRADGCTAVAMEVSSHALAHRRVDGTRFAVAAFTNLSQDHLDFHGSMEAYFAAKARLFLPDLAERGVVNADDPYGRRLLDRAAIPIRPYSMAEAVDLDMTATSSTFTWRGRRVHLPLGGDFNVSNALCAGAVAAELDVPADAVAAGLAALRPVPGRFEPVEAGQPFAVVVDYAHTPDGLEHLLTALRRTTAGRVIVVFGCGGDRDRAKRPVMGAVASRLADVVVVTSDNPRSEDPRAILADVQAGLLPGPDVVVEPDRRAAIAAAVDVAAPGDVVAIAGKGHETTQTVGDRVLPFDDRAVARDVLADRFGGRS